MYCGPFLPKQLPALFPQWRAPTPTRKQYMVLVHVNPNGLLLYHSILSLRKYPPYSTLPGRHANSHQALKSYSTKSKLPCLKAGSRQIISSTSYGQPRRSVHCRKHTGESLHMNTDSSPSPLPLPCRISRSAR